MAIKLTHERIAELIAEEKPLPTGYREILIGNKMKVEDAHKRGELKVTGNAGNTFYVKVRLNKLNHLSFSVILVYEFQETTASFNLRRYNGKHEHTNKIERNKFRDFHIHYATERYQEREFREEEYAEQTARYSDLAGALNCLIADCNFVLPPDEPPQLL